MPFSAVLSSVLSEAKLSINIIRYIIRHAFLSETFLKRSEEMQTLRAGCSKVGGAKNFAPP